MLITAGDMFRQYRVIEKVGEGGMGVVYRAHDTKLDRDVALKFMLYASGIKSELGGRLRIEARALAALSHPNILTIHDIGDAEGTPFLVLEWIGGGSLSIPSSHPPPRPAISSAWRYRLPKRWARLTIMGSFIAT